MAHRAEQIVDAVVAILTAGSVTNCTKHRILSYSADLELPATSVRLGPDVPPTDSPVQNIAFIDSVLSLVITTISSKFTEQAVISELLNIRRLIHVALMADQTLGLAFVSDTRYGGVSAPDLEATGEGIAGRMESTWTVPYRMNIADPQ